MRSFALDSVNTLMPRLSLWRENKSHDYKFIDRAISERYTIGGTAAYVHKYIGPKDTGPSTDKTQPQYTEQSIFNIQDLLFLENRDRKYDENIYQLRAVYTRSDTEFDLSQFGLFIANGAMFMTFHLNDMAEILGRKLMNGDVIELPHLRDDHVDDSLEHSLKRFYTVTDASWPAEGFSPTWYPHLWRVKLTPLVDSQEYKDILDRLKDEDGDKIATSTLEGLLNINQAIVDQANIDVKLSGQETQHLYTKPNVSDSEFGHSKSVFEDRSMAGEDTDTTDQTELYTPRGTAYDGYMHGDGYSPNGHPVSVGTSFPTNASIGDYHLRVDFQPQRLFRFDSRRWVRVEDVVRTSLNRGPGNLNQRSTFVNNDNTYIDENGIEHPEKQSMYEAVAFKAKPDES